MKDFRTPANTEEDFKARFQHYADLACRIQREVERALLYLVKARHASWPHANLCYSGGVALNAVANRRLLTEGPFERLYIQPAAGDNGIALGCAYYGWFEVLKKSRIPHPGSVYFGKRYEPDEITGTLERFAELVQFSRSPDVIAETASHLAEGRVVGWFQGGSEFGPRALGNRSILADPRLPQIRDHINAKVKFREDFRPFAPSVLAEDCAVYFDCDYGSPHMLLTAPVRTEWRAALPAVVHRDHSARIQTVTRDANPRYHALLSSFKEKTGIGVLLNTSLNRRGTPIAETPQDAIMLFLYSAIDVLVMEDYVLRKPPDFEARMKKFNTMVAQETAQRAFQKTRTG
jgi:carbamoyltransferase